VTVTAAKTALYVIDVGHGNCAVAVGEDWALMVDAGASAAVVQAIEHLELDRLDAVVISHRDLDHARGLVPLLSRSDLEIGAVYIGARRSQEPERAGDRDAAGGAGGRKTQRSLHRQPRPRRYVHSRRAERRRDLGRGAGANLRDGDDGTAGESPHGARMSSNSVSAVLRLTLSSGLRILLPGDMDQVALNELLTTGADLSADVLVFPHHGTVSGATNERTFAAEVTRAVGAHTALFSVGRGAKARPTKAVLQGVFDENPQMEIACTQLSSGCLDTAADLPGELTHLTDLPAAGRADCRSCAGSMTLVEAGLQGPEPAAHQRFIRTVAGTPMCRLARPSQAPQGDEPLRKAMSR
jgi:beta-lactamase superfamily II metal-dependent hydrolase